MKKTDEGSDKDRSNIALVLLGIITLALLIAFTWHYMTAKPPESELHTRPAAYLWFILDRRLVTDRSQSQIS